MYGCIAQALLFLAATAPSMSAAEAVLGLGPQWPSPTALHGLQVHVPSQHAGILPGFS